MAVTATLDPELTSAVPGGTSTLTLHVRNDGETPDTFALSAGGDLGGLVSFSPAGVFVEPGDTRDVVISVGLTPTTAPGPRSLTVGVASEKAAADATAPIETTTASATIEVEEVADHRVALRPERSRSSSVGRHLVVVDNRGNVPVMVDVSAELVAGDAVIDPTIAVIEVQAGATGSAELLVRPASRFSRGPAYSHRFHVRADGSDGRVSEFDGVFEQEPQLKTWHGAAAAAVVGGLLLALILWFALFRPVIDDIAEDAAESELAEQREAIDERIDELEEAAAEAKELPLGVATDLRLTAEATSGDESTDEFVVGSGRVFSITDIVFQNPSGAVGTVAIERDGEVLLESQLANFRDLDFHFVAPFRFEPGSVVSLRLTCDTPGPGATECAVAAALNGFDDQAS